MSHPSRAGGNLLVRLAHPVAALAVFCCPSAYGAAPEPPHAAIFTLTSPSTEIYKGIMNGKIADGIFLSGGGALISYCPILACVLEPTADHQRAAALFLSTSRDDGHSEEQTVAIETIVKTGFQRTWSPSTFFRKGDNLVQGARNAIYRATTSGVSAASGGGPEGKGTSIVDGGVRWDWVNDAAIGAKVGLYNELVAMPGAGAVWGQATNVSLSRGVMPTFASNTEFDFGNQAAPCVLGKQQCYNLFLETNGLMNTASIYVATANTTNPAAYFGILLAGDKLASDADLEDDGSARVGLGLCADKIRTCRHAEADIADASEGPVALKVTGHHSLATILDGSDAPAFASIGGHKTTAAIVDRSISPVGIDLAGRYAETQIKGSGWAVDPAGHLTATRFKAPLSTPKSAHDPCTVGEFGNDENYYYVCTAPNHWKRAALSDF